MAGDTYTGSVAYQDGWHVAVSDDGVPGERLYLENDGTYRLAADGDSSWHDRKHRGFVLISPEDGGKQVAVSAEEMAEIQKLLDEKRGV